MAALKSSNVTPLLRQSDVLRGYLDQLLDEVPDNHSLPVHTLPQVLPMTSLLELIARDAANPETLPTVLPETSWRERSLQVLEFYLAAIPLAIPINELCGLLPWTQKPARLPHYPAWHLGLITHRGVKVQIVDSVALLGLSQNIDAKRPTYSHLMLFDEGRWGLACDGFGDLYQLEPEQVKWRSKAGTQPWYAGLIKQRLCVLLDPGGLQAMLPTANRDLA